MTGASDRYVSASTVSEAWLEAVRAVEPMPERKAVHLVVRIAHPEQELDHIRAAADELVASARTTLPTINTVRNTIFPAEWARRYPEPADLAAFYRSKYGRQRGLRRLGENQYGTYFGRIVAYPHRLRKEADDLEQYSDQLTQTVKKLREAVAKPGGKSSRYEINIYNELRDGKRLIGFPCLSFISLHLHHQALHMQATYRNEYLVARGYGNYQGLAQLQGYLARACNLDRPAKLAPIHSGELLITAGHVELDNITKPRLNRLYERAAPG